MSRLQAVRDWCVGITCVLSLFAMYCGLVAEATHVRTRLEEMEVRLHALEAIPQLQDIRLDPNQRAF